MEKRKTRLLCLLLACLLLTGCAGAEPEKTTVTVERIASPAASPAAAPASAPAGEWYGWWHISHTSGDWAHMYGYWWDCAAWLGETGAGSFSLTLRGEDMLDGEPTIFAQLERTESGFICTSGRLLDAPLTGDSTFLLSEDDCGALLTIRGHYIAVNSKGAFDYEFFLRPWGSRWPEKEDELPLRYRDWYLPLVEAGEGMPPTLWGDA